MGIFDGYLICSDVDGTFTGGDRTAENIEAIRYFNANGGHFTFATGRAANHLRECGLLPAVNCPVCLCNGSVIYDYTTEQILREMHVSFSIGEFLDAIKEKAHTINRLHTIFSGTGMITVFDRNTASDEVLAAKPVKLVCRFDTPEAADDFKHFAMELPLFRDSFISKSWSHGVEFNNATGTKGHGLQFLKNHLGNIHTAVGIGDYENDLPLITHADIGVAVENAIPQLKEKADLLVCNHKDAAIRDLVDKLESHINKERL